MPEPETFDPEVHQADDEGQPVVTSAGRYAKKRGPKSAPSAASPRRTARKSTSRPSAPRSKAPDFRPGLNGMFQLIAAPLAFVQPLDAMAVAQHGPNVAEALNDLAQERPEVAMVLQRLLSVGPYGLVIAAVLPLAVQVLHNHDVLPAVAAQRLGAVPKEQLLAELGIVPEPVPEDASANPYWPTSDNVADNDVTQRLVKMP